MTYRIAGLTGSHSATSACRARGVMTTTRSHDAIGGLADLRHPDPCPASYRGRAA
ncbi:hypothetical protein [Paracoccus sp. (in: a-proteobacteria)]|uniref:hypothetical protein n=1 Tax=Paracoccus sp. TaxID=267 RepID=UPI002AFE9D39|nr:hypothetical protein [Paracoccus sp. (in: a-proteobacteria)]